MINDTLHRLLLLPKEDKNLEWASKIVSEIRANSTPLIYKSEYDKLRNVIYGKFPNIDIEKLFRGKEMSRAKAKLSNSTVYMFERVRNALIDDRASSPLSTTVNSLDPTKASKKERDKELLKNRAAIEAVLGDITNNAGMPPEQVGEKDFEGNIKEFDKNGYNPSDPEDINAFFDNKYALNSEIHLQNAINAVTRNNQITRNYPNWIDDILICLYVASRVYVDALDGDIVTEYYKPYEIRTVGRTRSADYKDSQAICTEKGNTVRSFVRMVGDNFNFEENWKDLLGSINQNSLSDEDRYTGIIGDDFGELLYGDLSKPMTMTGFLNSEISYGYVEWKAFNANVKYKKEVYGVVVPTKKLEDSEMDGSLGDATKISEETYKSYYIITGATAQKLIGFGTLYMQPTEGANDQYSGFSFKIFKRNGVSAAEIIKPYWEIMQRAFQMTEMLINDVKPDGNLYLYESLVKIAEYLQTATDAPTDITNTLDNVMEMYNDSPNKLTSIPRDDADNIIGGGAFGVQKLKNGLNDAAPELIKIMDWVEMKIEKHLATSGITNPEGREGYKVSLESKMRSRAATAYIDYILLNHLEDVCITILNYVQDIAKFKDIPAYKYLEFLIGIEALEYINSLEKSPHRHGIFLDTFNNDIPLMELKERASIALDRGVIDYGQYAVVMLMDNPKQIIFYMTHEVRKHEKQKQKDAMSLIEQQRANDAQKHKERLELEDKKGEWMRLARAEEAKGFLGAAEFNSSASITRAQIQQEGQSQRVQKEGENKIKEISEKYNREEQLPT